MALELVHNELKTSSALLLALSLLFAEDEPKPPGVDVEEVVLLLPEAPTKGPKAS